MAAQQTKKAPGAHYSGNNPIPNVQKFIESLDKDKKERDAKINEQMKAKKANGTAGSDVKEHKQGQPTGVEGTRKTVTDPTTGKEVQIEDVNADFMQAVKNPMLSVPNANLNKDTPVKTSSDQSGREYQHNQDITAPPDPVEPGSTSDVPIHGEKTNILFHPTPSVSYEPMYASLEKSTLVLAGGVMIAIVVLGKMFGGALYGLIPLGMCVGSGIFLWMKELIRKGREMEWSSEKERGEVATANLIPESVEWMNTLLGVMWGLIDPDMFIGVADTLEDVMQASVPGVIENVRVAEINQGTNPIRILSLRALPDDHMKEMKDDIRSQNEKVKDPQELAADEEGGDYYNIECSFAYHAAPSGTSTSGKAKNMHMQLVFYLGVKGLFGVPLPIFVELQGLVGTVRIRLQMSPEPPFLKALTFTLMGLPQVQAGCIPMIETGINILNLPLISNFVNYAIGAAANEYVAPKSMTLDMGKMLQGDDIQKDVLALGVLWIRIHKATGLSKQDRRGSDGGGSDPYITVSFSKYGKPMYCTRVIEDNLNPVWEETCALLVTPELIKADEQLSMELWDSDRSTADDVVGKVELSMQKMIQHPGKMYPQVSKLRGTHSDSSMPGELHWEVGYFGKPQFRPALRTHGKDINLPDQLKDKKELQDEKGAIDNADEDAVVHTPPDPLWPSGICSVVVHQIVNLELANLKGSEGKRKGREFEPAQDSGENKEEESKKLPSSYCTILFNDELVYRTRTKVVSSKPIFNAGTERFMRDWRSGIVTVTVRDQRMRQHDPILGVVPLKLSDILQTSSQVTRWYPLDGGIGFGRVRISLLFRSVETRLPPSQLGWDVGTFEFTSDKILATGYHTQSKLKMRTGGSSGKIGRAHCKKTDEGDGIYWNMSGEKGHEHNVRLPVKYRYRSPVVFEFHSATHRSADAYAVVWLHHLEDNKEENISIPIWKTDKGMRLTQNYITEENFKDIPDLKIEEVGRLQFRGRFKAGTDADHAHFISDNDSRETHETWEACNAEGVRETVVTKELPPAVQELHDQSLTQGRDVLSQADEEDKKKWLSKDGTDWSGAFGEDPAKYTDKKGTRSSGGETGKRQAVDASDDDGDYDSSDSSSDLGIQDADHGEDADGAADGESTNGEGATGSTHHKNPIKQVKSYNEGKGEMHRKHRGLMQWKPMRNLQFAKDETKYAVRRTFKKGSLAGRQPDVETET
ncbi:C2 (Calcium/lipid-binding, CaLB) [Glarea lozoyensis ATCC 20868]|uniref:C2 (Calcium/lipid-binding, CaLB) n=1 Tax=Glarea lozoyensis (strain ATCC 20868 / MF5171) TaxID=1116229 RepID=S3EAC0_GLAL2|nr:C2 (Calcium/lipid-binding, CaLB) [Glarea lozoyensis ATCC 20868]EPE35263.1 C2 (Calcium/lipid-binding, CaLB) [Glarea lozoyensis ATCC 20868]